MKEESKLIKVKDLAEWLSVPAKSVYALIDNKVIPNKCVIYIGSRIRFIREEVSNWLKEINQSNIKESNGEKKENDRSNK